MRILWVSHRIWLHSYRNNTLSFFKLTITVSLKNKQTRKRKTQGIYLKERVSA